MHESEKWKKSLSHVQLLVTPWTAAYQASPSMGFSRQEYWSGVPLPSPIALTRRIFVDKVMSLLFNMLSRLVITFLPRSKHLLISWLEWPPAVTLEPRKINSATVSPSICHEVMGPDDMIFIFWMLSFKPTFSLSSFTFTIVGQKIENIAPVLCLQFILSHCTNDILLSFSQLMKLHYVIFLGCFVCFNKILHTEWLRKNWNMFLTVLKLKVWDPCGWVMALLQVTGFSLNLNMVVGPTELSQVSYMILFKSHACGLYDYVLITSQKLLTPSRC